mmetsp:Transcript_13026/g.38247  ORF Transcript_13026/g.38247 Transcript_13026/m.38247 type:complete len:450 (-) Transcript_13026:566-1915(-)
MTRPRTQRSRRCSAGGRDARRASHARGRVQQVSPPLPSRRAVPAGALLPVKRRAEHGGEVFLVVHVAALAHAAALEARVDEVVHVGRVLVEAQVVAPVEAVEVHAVRHGEHRVAHLDEAELVGLLGLGEHLCPRVRAAYRLLLVLGGARAVVVGALVEEVGVHLHEELDHVAGERVHRGVPVRPRVCVERLEDDGQDLLSVLRDEGDHVLVVPEEERALRHLEVGRADAVRHLGEEGLHDEVELVGVDHLEDLLNLVEEEHLLGRVGEGPEGEDGLEHGHGELGVLLHELGHAVAQLLVVDADELDLVQRQQRAHQEGLVLVLEREREAVDDGAEDLQQLRDAVVPLRLVDELVEDVVDGLADEGAVGHELAVDAVQDGLEVVALARVLRVEELEEPQEEVRVEVALHHLGVRLVAHDEAQQELVDVLQVRPRGLEGGLVFLRVVDGGA